MKSNQVRDVFADLRIVYVNRDQYKLEWAFKNAQEEMDAFRHKVLTGDLEQQCASCRKKREAMEKFQALMDNSHSVEKKSKWVQRFFHNIYSILTLAEVGVSFSLVFLLSQISHMSGSLIASEGLSILFAMTFSFLKVVLERYYVEPRMNQWGWQVYIDSVDRLNQMTMELVTVANGEESMIINQIPAGLMGGMRKALQRQRINRNQQLETMSITE